MCYIRRLVLCYGVLQKAANFGLFGGDIQKTSCKLHQYYHRNCFQINKLIIIKHA